MLLKRAFRVVVYLARWGELRRAKLGVRAATSGRTHHTSPHLRSYPLIKPRLQNSCVKVQPRDLLTVS